MDVTLTRNTSKSTTHLFLASPGLARHHSRSLWVDCKSVSDRELENASTGDNINPKQDWAGSHFTMVELCANSLAHLRPRGV